MKKRKKNRKRVYLVTGIGAAAIAGASFAIWSFMHRNVIKPPEPPELLSTYMSHIENREYEAMYSMLDVEASGGIGMEDFEKRNSAIYEGIEASDLKIYISEYDEENHVVSYETSLDTVAGTIQFENTADFIKGEDGYRLIWNDRLIFPGLGFNDKVRISTKEAERGQIFDRNGRMLAGKGTASSVGIVPGKLSEPETAIPEIATLLSIAPETIEKKLSASWVKDDYFVPIKTVPKIREIDLMSYEPDEEMLAEKERQDNLLAIDGVMISDTEVREYPLKEAAAHLVGYVQNVTAEDLEKHEGEGYTANDVIGRSGMESLFEMELKGQNGCEIYIVDGDGQRKETLCSRPVKNGKDIHLTIDADVQEELYEKFKDDKSCSVAMDQYTGEVLALVSTPSYDNNAFILGLSQEKWESLNNDEAKPLYNRFRQVWCPGSSFKPVIAEIGLDSGAIDPQEDYGNVGLKWQKDASWGSYYVTTLHEYEPVILENALIYSDNIYFAKAALKIGTEDLESSLERIGFNKELPFEIAMSKSQYSNAEHIASEIQLADSGYGQGQILVNPLHLACIYTSLCNDGNMMKPRLTDMEGSESEVWIENAFSADVAERVLDGTRKVVSDPHGTGRGAFREDISLAGKTGTAEIKMSKEDVTGTELGWFALFTTDKDLEHPLLILTMVEDVKGRGGSGYVVTRVSDIMNWWLDERR